MKRLQVSCLDAFLEDTKELFTRNAPERFRDFENGPESEPFGWAENQYTQSTGAYKDAVRPLSPNM